MRSWHSRTPSPRSLRTCTDPVVAGMKLAFWREALAREADRTELLFPGTELRLVYELVSSHKQIGWKPDDFGLGN
jgi:hypothetical protein